MSKGQLFWNTTRSITKTNNKNIFWCKKGSSQKDRSYLFRASRISESYRWISSSDMHSRCCEGKTTSILVCTPAFWSYAVWGPKNLTLAPTAAFRTSEMYGMEWRWWWGFDRCSMTSTKTCCICRLFDSARVLLITLRSENKQLLGHPIDFIPIPFWLKRSNIILIPILWLLPPFRSDSISGFSKKVGWF